MTHFTEEEVTRMVTHMNEDHADSVLLYAQAYGGKPEAVSAQMEGIDATGMDITARLPDGSSLPLRIPFDHELEDAHDAHMTLVKMSKAAR